jgi:hypothetical protein
VPRRLQRYVLAEMIKVSHIDIGALVTLVKSYDVQPDWFSMQLPNGKPRFSRHDFPSTLCRTGPHSLVTQVAT